MPFMSGCIAMVGLMLAFGILTFLNLFCLILLSRMGFEVPGSPLLVTVISMIVSFVELCLLIRLWEKRQKKEKLR